ncbi:MAG: MG321/MPN456 family lipoprotein [Mycoplasmoidaceae bacterium]
MRKKKIIKIFSLSLLFFIPIGSLIAVTILSNEQKVSSSYIYYPFSAKSKELKKQISDTLDKTIGKKGKLDIKFDTLTKEQVYTSSQNAWFVELKSALKWIDKRLGFERVPKTNESLQRAHYDLNTMMCTFFWNADYNNVGSWLGYNFSSNQFSTSNLYPSLFYYSENHSDKGNFGGWETLFNWNKDSSGNFIDDNGNPVSDGRPVSNESSPLGDEYQPKNWLKDLALYLAKSKINQEYIDAYNHAEIKYKPFADPYETSGPDTDRIGTISNLSPSSGNHYLYSWNQLEAIDKAIYSVDHSLGNVAVRNILWNKIGYWGDIKAKENDESKKYWIGLLGWMNKQEAAIPWVSAGGPNYTDISLASNGLHPVINTNTFENYRDWYYNQEVTKKSDYIEWNEKIPYEGLTNLFNPNFTRAPNYEWFQSTWNKLVDYRAVGDWRYDNNKWTAPQEKLFTEGTTKIELYDNNNPSNLGNPIATIGNPDGTVGYDIKPQDLSQLSNTLKFDFTIPNGIEKGKRAFYWYAPDGKKEAPLTAKDYFAGFLSYYLSSKWHYNSNGYFDQLMNIDVNKTIEANKEYLNNPEPPFGDWTSINRFDLKKNVTDNHYKIILSSPNVNALDILTMQYFCPNPSSNPGVNKILYDNTSFFNGTSINDKDPSFKEVYGYGEQGSTNISGWWSAGPYNIVKTNGNTEFDFKKNNDFFDNFDENYFHPPPSSYSSNPYVQPLKITMKFGNGYSIQNTYEQFGSNETDISKIPQGNMAEALSKYKDDIRTIGVDKIPQSDLLFYNTNVFLTDKYGGETNQLKSAVSESYKNAIINDFYKGEDGMSYKIRNAINQLVDWYSLASLASPSVEPYYQNSIIPFGNDKIDEINHITFFEKSLENAWTGFLDIPQKLYIENWKNQLR